MGIGEQIFAARKAKGMTQTLLAEKIGVSVEAVSKWERNLYAPNDDKLKKLDELLEISLYNTDGDLMDVRFFDEDHMSAFLKGKFNAHSLTEASKALSYAKEKHAGALRKPETAGIPYINHPLTMACHALAMSLEDDELLAALLLHDVSEDCNVAPGDLPFSLPIQEIVRLVTKPKDKAHFSESAYYAAILENPKACLVKCIDRCNNVSSMSFGFSDEKIAEYIRETESYYPALLKAVKACPEYNNAAWLLSYQIKSVLAMAKRINRFSSST